MSTETLEKPKVSDSDTKPGEKHIFCGVCYQGNKGEPFVAPALCGEVAPCNGTSIYAPPQDCCEGCTEVAFSERPRRCGH